MQSACCAILLCSASLAGADDASTPEDIKAAAEEFDHGRRAFKAKEYVEAAEHFEAADSHAPSATALELALRSRDRAGQLDRSATLAALAQQRYPDSEFTRKLAPGILKRASEELFELSAKCDTPCELVVDQKLLHGHAATERVFYLIPGTYTIRAGWSGGRTVNEDVEAAKGAKGEVSFREPPLEKPEEASPVPAPSPAPVPQDDSDPPTVDRGPEKRDGWSPVVFWIGAGVTAVAGAATIWSGIDTQNNPGPDRVKTECAGQGPSCELYQDGRDRQLRTNVLIGVTAGVGVATILIGAFATDWTGPSDSALAPGGPHRTQAKAQKVAVEPWLGVGEGVTLGGARGRF